MADVFIEHGESRQQDSSGSNMAMLAILIAAIVVLLVLAFAQNIGNSGSRTNESSTDIDAGTPSINVPNDAVPQE